MMKFVANLMIAFILAGTIAVGLSTPAAASDCYYNDYYDYRGTSPSPSIYWTSEVWYQIGFSCNGQGQSILVKQFHSRFDIYEAPYNTEHRIGSSLVGGFGGWPVYWEDYDGSHFCNGACVVEKWDSPWVTTPYNFDIETHTSLRACSIYVSNICDLTHYFLRGEIDVRVE